MNQYPNKLSYEHAIIVFFFLHICSKCLQLTVHIWAKSGREVREATFGHFWSVATLWNEKFWCVSPIIHTPSNPPTLFFLNNWLSVERFQEKKKKTDADGSNKIPSF